MQVAMELAPVELVVLTFPGSHADPSVAAVLADVVARNYVTLLDLVFLSRAVDEKVTMTDADDDLAAVGLGMLDVQAQPLISEHDIDRVRDGLEPGTSAAVIVYEETWARRVSDAVREAGGELSVHLSLDPTVVATALAAATLPVQ
jgi:uncharacterized membrane protein